MKKIMNVLFAGAAVLLMAGCDSINELRSSINEAGSGEAMENVEKEFLVNKTTKAEILKKLGAPSLCFANEIGGETWVYNRVATRNTGLGVNSSIGAVFAFPWCMDNPSRGGGAAGGSASASLNATRCTYKTASLMINFNRQGCINTYKYVASSF